MRRSRVFLCIERRSRRYTVLVDGVGFQSLDDGDERLYIQFGRENYTRLTGNDSLPMKFRSFGGFWASRSQTQFDVVR